MIWCKDVLIRLDTQEILSQVTLTILPGTSHIIQGANGSGKSVLLKMIVGLLSKQIEGTVDCHISKKQMCYLTQDTVFYAKERILDILRYYRLLYGVDCRWLLETLQIQESDRTQYGDLSAGTRRKLELFPLFLDHFEIYVLDEILVHLDTDTKQYCLDRLASLESKQKAIVWVDHAIDPFKKEVRRYECRNGVFLNHGS